MTRPECLCSLRTFADSESAFHIRQPRSIHGLSLVVHKTGLSSEASRHSTSELPAIMLLSVLLLLSTFVQYLSANSFCHVSLGAVPSAVFAFTAAVKKPPSV